MPGHPQKVAALPAKSGLLPPLPLPFSGEVNSLFSADWPFSQDLLQAARRHLCPQIIQAFADHVSFPCSAKRDAHFGSRETL